MIQWKFGGIAIAVGSTQYFRHKVSAINREQLKEKNKVFSEIFSESENALNEIFKMYIEDTRYDSEYSSEDWNHLGVADSEKVLKEQEDKKRVRKFFVRTRNKFQYLPEFPFGL